MSADQEALTLGHHQPSFLRGWQMAMQLVQGECEDDGQPIPDCVIEALRPCEHVDVYGDECRWCGEKVAL